MRSPRKYGVRVADAPKEDSEDRYGEPQLAAETIGAVRDGAPATWVTELQERKASSCETRSGNLTSGSHETGR